MELIQVNFTSKIKQAIDGHFFNLKMIATYAKNQCTDKSNFINNIIEVINIYHPKNILKKGYAIPRYKGTLLKDQQIKQNEELEIELQDRTLIVSFLKIKEKWKIFLTNPLQKN